MKSLLKKAPLFVGVMLVLVIIVSSLAGCEKTHKKST